MPVPISVIREVTEDWLSVFNQSVANGEVLADSVFWRMALMTLPEGVDQHDPRVRKALSDIQESMNARG